MITGRPMYPKESDNVNGKTYPNESLLMQTARHSQRNQGKC